MKRFKYKIDIQMSFGEQYQNTISFINTLPGNAFFLEASEGQENNLDDSPRAARGLTHSSDQTHENRTLLGDIGRVFYKELAKAKQSSLVECSFHSIDFQNLESN